MEVDRKTSWDDYYKNPFFLSKYTRVLLAREVLRAIQSLSPSGGPLRLVELGGANSSVYDRVGKVINLGSYVVVDNNCSGLRLFRQRHSNDPRVFLCERDLLEGDLEENGADISLSFGLIEHFSDEEMEKVVRQHFIVTKPGGYVIMSFPTPTILYRIIRRAAEILGLWKFPDERPLTIAKVVAETGQYGVMISKKVIWSMGLTQALVVMKKRFL